MVEHNHTYGSGACPHEDCVKATGGTSKKDLLKRSLAMLKAVQYKGSWEEGYCETCHHIATGCPFCETSNWEGQADPPHSPDCLLKTLIEDLKKEIKDA